MGTAREMPRAHITLLLSQAISLTAPSTHIGISGLETALMGTKQAKLVVGKGPGKEVSQD